VRSKSTATDLVSEADLASERAIQAGLARRRPDDGLLGEEGAARTGSSGLRWVVDPLDGTINFLFGLPQWCVSVAVEDAQGPLAGVVYDPLRDELFAARRDGPATLNGEPFERPERTPDLGHALVATGFAYDARVRAAQAPALARILAAARDVRRFGSAAMDLVWTAAGRFDVYYERGVKRWDVAAGVLVCERVGLEMRELPELPDLPWGVLVAPGEIVEDVLGFVAGP
jgi:myo-inositol-1(or 4)-monophosphatase